MNTIAGDINRTPPNQIPLMNTDTPPINEVQEIMRRSREAEKALLFGTYNYDMLAGTVEWSEGVYDILCSIARNKPLDHDAFISYVLCEDAAKLDSGLKRKLLSQKEYNENYQITCDDKKNKIVQLIGKRIHDENGNVIKDTGLIRDVTLEKEKETITNRAINELLTSNKELESFAYVASHDLQEPVRKVSTFTGRLASKLADKVDGESEMYLKRIIASAENMRLLIDNLLEYSRISRNIEPFADTNLNFILQQVKTDLELVIEETGTTIHSDKLPNIIASSVRMKQLLNNVIGNSIKFIKPGVPPVINIASSVLTANEKKEYPLNEDLVYYKIAISDNGIGFEEEYSQKIFQVFQRLNGKSEYPGSGIGLAICKKIVEQHHGVIYAEGVLGKGATVFIILPEKQ